MVLPDIRNDLVLKIGDLRRSLIGEFDKGREDTALQLAKTYLSVGMLDEARGIVTEYAAETPFGEFLLDLTRIVDGEPVDVGSSVFKESCLGMQALWRALAQAKAEEFEAALKSELSSGAALEEFPLYTRQIIAAELGLVAARQGAWRVAADPGQPQSASGTRPDSDPQAPAAPPATAGFLPR